jgi:hypothetical protein
MSSFAANGAIFRQDPNVLRQRMGDRFDPSKQYPAYSGTINVPADQAYAIAEYLMNAQPNERNEIPVSVSGWDKSSNTQPWYMSVQLKPDSRVQPAAAPAAAAPAAPSAWGPPGAPATPAAPAAPAGWGPPGVPAAAPAPAPAAAPAMTPPPVNPPGWGPPPSIAPPAAPAAQPPGGWQPPF